MKKLIFILTLCYFSVSAQEIPKQTLQSLAGQELQTAATMHYAGLCTALGGGLIMAGGLYQLSKDKEDVSGKIFTGIGGAVFIIGVSVNISAFSHINKAGKKLQQIE